MNNKYRSIDEWEDSYTHYRITVSFDINYNTRSKSRKADGDVNKIIKEMQKFFNRHVKKNKIKAKNVNWNEE